MVETSLIGVVLNGLSHLHNVRNKAHFAVCLIHGLGGNLNEGSREAFAKEVESLSLSKIGNKKLKINQTHVYTIKKYASLVL